MKSCYNNMSWEVGSVAFRDVASHAGVSGEKTQEIPCAY